MSFGAKLRAALWLMRNKCARVSSFRVNVERMATMAKDENHDEVEDTSSSFEASSPSQSPGKILKAAREAKFRTQAEVAEQLRLSVQTVKDIESDDFSHSPALIYTRGYLRAYARAVEVPEDDVLAAFDALNVHEPDVPDERKVHVGAQSIPVFTQSEGHASRSLRWITVCIAIALVAFVVMWWRDQTNHQFSPQLQSAISKKHKPQVGTHVVPNTTTDNNVPAPGVTSVGEQGNKGNAGSHTGRGASDLNAPLRPDVRSNKKSVKKKRRRRRRSESWTEQILPIPMQSITKTKTAKTKEKVRAGSRHG